jgi:hypothetical protein
MHQPPFTFKTAFSFTRLPGELSDSIARWFAAGASHHVYYMWEGGNHMARWAGASVTNMCARAFSVSAFL